MKGVGKTQVLIGDPKIKLTKAKYTKLIKKAKTELWELCKQYCRKKWGNTCYTCGRGNLSGSNWHTGHAIPSALCPFELDYHPDNLRPQDYFCNINLGGNGSAFIEKLRLDNGQDYIDNLFKMKNQPKITKPTLEDYQEYIEKYKQLIKDL